MDERYRSAEQQSAKPTAGGAFARLADSAAQLMELRAKQAKDATAPATGWGLRGGMLLAGSALAALLGLQALTAAAIVALNLALPLWGAALVTGAALLAGAGVAGMIGAHQMIRAWAVLRAQRAENSDIVPARSAAESR